MLTVIERLKEMTVGKKAAEEALMQKSLALDVLQKKNARLTQECTVEGRARLQAEMDIKALQEQVSAVTRHNATLTGKAKGEARSEEHTYELQSLMSN